MSPIWDRTLWEKSRTPRVSGVNLKKIESEIEQVILSSNRDKAFQKKVNYSPSGFGGSSVCPRFHYFAFNGAEFEQFNDALSIFAMSLGNLYADPLEKSIVEKSDVFTERQTLVTNESPPIKGYTDLIGVEGETSFVLDFKTCGDEKFNKIVNSGRPENAHLVQLLLYMRILRFKEGVLCYVNRNTGKKFLLPISISERNKMYVSYIFDWLIETKRWADEESEVPSRAFPKSNWICKGCALKDLCNSVENVKKVGPGKLEIDIDKWDVAQS